MSAIYGIKWAYNVNDSNDPTESNTINLLMETAKRIASKPKIKKGVVTTEMLQTLCKAYTDCEDILDLRDLCMITLAYEGFLRFNELSNLHRIDISFKPDHMILKIRKSKTDIYRHWNEVLMAKGSS